MVVWIRKTLLIFLISLTVGCAFKSSSPVSPNSEPATISLPGDEPTVKEQLPTKEKIDISHDEPRSMEAIKSEMLKLFPESDDQLKIQGEVKLFTEETLYEHINGASDAFFAYGFQLCGTADYTPPLDPEQFIRLDIYDMGKPIQAFGMYMSEYYSGVKPIDLGVEGYLEMPMLNFWKGPYYVKISASSENLEPLMMKLGRSVDSKIRWSKESPQMLSLLPTKNQIAKSQRFILKNILGFEFLKNGVTATYKLRSGNERQFYVMEYASSDLAKEALNKLTSHGVKFDKISTDGDESFAIDSKYYKRIIAVRKDRFILMSVSFDDDSEAVEVINTAIDLLP